MIGKLFEMDKFNILEDNDNYYVYRALNNADHLDKEDGILETRIRTDRERSIETSGFAKYAEDSELTLEEIFDHIKMRYLKETNCISLSTNANVSLDYGSNYYDEYAIIKIPKNSSNDYYSAGSYMLREIEKIVELTISNNKLDTDISNILYGIDNANSNEEVLKLVYEYQERFNDDNGIVHNIMSRFQERQYFSLEQQLVYNKLIAKLSILELGNVLPSIISTDSDNSRLLATVNNAFSSGEVIHYNDIEKKDYKEISRQMINILALIQQMKDKKIEGVNKLEEKVLSLINNNYDFAVIDGKIVITNGEEVIDCKLDEDTSFIMKKYDINPELTSVQEIYNMTGGSIDYAKAKKTIDFCYLLAFSKKDVYDYARIIEQIMGNADLTEEVVLNTFAINADIIDRGNEKGYRLCESVNIGMDNKNSSFYSKRIQERFIKTMNDLDNNVLNKVISSDGLILRRDVLRSLVVNNNNALSKEMFYASSVVNSLDFEEIIPTSITQDYFTEQRLLKLTEDLSKSNVVNLYEAFHKLNISHDQISLYIVNLFLEGSYKGYSFNQICNLSSLDEFISDNISKFNNVINPVNVCRYFGIENDINYISDTGIVLRDFQLRIKDDIDSIYNDGRRFAGVVLPTGGGKSFVAMTTMLDRRDESIVYIAPRIEILRQFKKHIIRYVAGLNPDNYSDIEQDEIVEACFPHLGLYCYQGLDKDDTEKLKKYDADFIILDELHHVGADKWAPAINELLNHNKKSKVLGLTATPIRDDIRGKISNDHDLRDADMMYQMAKKLDNYTEEELSKKTYLASNMTIIDAIQSGYVVCPQIVSFDYYIDELPQYKEAAKILQRVKDPEVREELCDKYQQMEKLIKDAKLHGLDKIIKENIKDPTGRYILFLPRRSHSQFEDIEEYFNQEIDNFRESLKLVDEEPVIEYIYSTKGDKQNSVAIRNFESDDNPDHIKILVAVDMLNEGAHLKEIKGSFNFRKIDSNHLILSSQQLGRIIFALDPTKELKEEDIPVLFDKYNNYSNLNMERTINRTTHRSDLEKMKDIVWWCKKYGYVPQTDSIDTKEKRKAIMLRKIQIKYKNYLDSDKLESLSLNNEEKYEISEIIRLGKKINLWNIEFSPITKEEEREVNRVNIFNISATQQSFLDLWSDMNAKYNESIEYSDIKLNKGIRLESILSVLDYLSEYDIELNPSNITKKMILDDLLKLLPKEIREDILYELLKRGIKENYNVGKEYYFARNELAKQHGKFNEYLATPDNITSYRKYGLYENDDEFQFTDNKGFIILGPKRFIGFNVWTGTKFSEDGYNMQGYDENDFSESGIYLYTGKKYDQYGFAKNLINKYTNTKYDKHNFDIKGINKDTGEVYNLSFFDRDGYFYEEKDGQYVKTRNKYDNDGYDIDGYNRDGYDRNNNHRDTGKPYNGLGYDIDGYYWKETENGRIKTNKFLNDNNFNAKGEFFEEIDGVLVNRGVTYDNHGFFFDGIHYKTHTKYDERGFDANCIWYRLNDNGEYECSNSKFNDAGWNIDGYTVRHTVYGTTFLDYVNDYGFDEDHNYHKPIESLSVGKDPVPVRFNENGYTNLYTGTIRYKKKVGYSFNSNYDIHGFNAYGIHKDTGTNLNPNGFDIAGYWYKLDENNRYVNTYQLCDDLGWTIDKRKVVKNGNTITYEKYYNGFDADGINKFTGEIIDENGFDQYGINDETGTILDRDNFDAHGYYYKKNEDGIMINTNSIFADDGWSRNHLHVSTGSFIDDHGFNYLHLYKKKNGSLSLYDNHGFDFQGIHRTTKTNLNRNHFDRDGYWYREDENGGFINTFSKYDEEGLDVDRLTRHKFSKNEKYLGGKNSHNLDGFDAMAIHNVTGERFDLNGLDIDRNKVALTSNEIEKLKEIRKKIDISRRKSIYDIFEEMSISDKLDLIDSYDLTDGEFIDYEYFDDFVEHINKNGINDSGQLYTLDEIMDFVIKNAEKLSKSRKQENMYDVDNSFYYTERNGLDLNSQTMFDDEMFVDIPNEIYKKHYDETTGEWVR